MKVESFNPLDEQDLDKSIETLGAEKPISTTLLPGFLQAVMRTYSSQGIYLVCRRGEDIEGLASFYVRSSVIGKKSFESVPGGFWAAGCDAEKLLADKLFEIARHDNLKGPFFNDLQERMSSREDARVTYRAVVDLSRDDLQGSYGKDVRRNIRLARKNGITVEEADEYETFHYEWSRRMRDLGTPVIPLSFLKNLKSHYKLDMRLLLLKRQDRYIGGAVLLRFRDTMTNLFSGCRTDMLSSHAVPLLWHETLAFARDRGCTSFDLGRSQPGSGNEKFKIRFGARLEPLYSYPDRRFQDGRLFRRFFVPSWKRLPLRVANAVGPKIRRYVPFGN